MSSEVQDSFSVEEAFKQHVAKRIQSAVHAIPIHKSPVEMTAASRLLDKRKELSEAEKSLLQAKEEYSLKSKSITERREELIKKENQLKDALVKFDKFLKENDAKRVRAEKKSIEERKFKATKEKEISGLNEDLRNMYETREDQLKKIDELMKYHQFLESALELLPEYGDIRDIIARFETLKQTNSELMQRAGNTQSESEIQRGIYTNIVQNKQTRILNYNNTLAKHQYELEEYEIKHRRTQESIDSVMNAKQERSLLYGQLKMAIGNIFSLVQSHLKGRIPTMSDPTQQLEEIEKFFMDINAIVKELK